MNNQVINTVVMTSWNSVKFNMMINLVTVMEHQTSIHNKKLHCQQWSKIWIKEQCDKVITSISDNNIHIYWIKFTMLSIKELICINIRITAKNFGTTTVLLSSQYSVICNVDFFSPLWIKLYWMTWPIFCFCVAPKMDIVLSFSKTVPLTW